MNASTMNEFVKPTLVLTVICLIITLLLAISQNITEPIIEENNRRIAEESRAEVLAEADSFEQVQGEFPDGVSDVYAAANGTGYTITVSSKGYSSDPLQVMVGIKEDGTIERIKILANNEHRVSAPKFLTTILSTSLREWTARWKALKQLVEQPSPRMR